VKLLLRLTGFACGAIIGVVVVGMLEYTFHWIWLPVLMGVIVSTIVGFQPWFTASRLSRLFCVALTVGAAVTYSMSVAPQPNEMGPKFPRVAIDLGACVFLVVLGLFIARCLLQRKTAKMAAWLLLPIAAGCVLGYVSGGIGGSDHMVEWAIRVLHMSREQAETGVHYLRKTIHLCAYGTLGLAYFRAAITGGAEKSRSIGFALLSVLTMASFDELRQTTAPNRTGSIWDVMLDVTGAFIFVMLASAFVKKTKPSAKPAQVKLKKQASRDA